MEEFTERGHTCSWTVNKVFANIIVVSNLHWAACVLAVESSSPWSPHDLGIFPSTVSRLTPMLLNKAWPDLSCRDGGLSGQPGGGVWSGRTLIGLGQA
jgi:hypothetical protein